MLVRITSASSIGEEVWSGMMVVCVCECVGVCVCGGGEVALDTVNNAKPGSNLKATISNVLRLCRFKLHD